MSHMKMILASSLIAMSLASAQYKEIEVRNGGSITGRVGFSRADAPTDQLAISKDEAICGRMKISPSLVFGRTGGVKDALIVVGGIRQGKKWSMNTRPVLDQKSCEYEPHVILAPKGAQLEIVNSDPILHNVHAYEMKSDLRTVFNIAQPIKGQRTAIEQTKLNTPGLFYAACDAGHPWMTAYIIVAEHPYYVLTDSEGNFSIDDIPEGTYTVRMWHEGIRISDRELERGVVKKYLFEKPYELTRSVEVRKGITTTVEFELAPRP